MSSIDPTQPSVNAVNDRSTTPSAATSTTTTTTVGTSSAPAAPVSRDGKPRRPTLVDHLHAMRDKALGAHALAWAVAEYATVGDGELRERVQWLVVRCEEATGQTLAHIESVIAELEQPQPAS